jgi:hypothetical protein
MTKPTLYDFALIKFSDMETVPEFTALCGIVGVQVNQTVETQDRRVRDCDTPALAGDLDSTIVGTTWTISGTGRTNADQRATIQDDLLAKKINYRVEYYKVDGTNAGELLGTDAGLAIMEAVNINTDPDSGTSDMEITLKGQGALTYTAAP